MEIEKTKVPVKKKRWVVIMNYVIGSNVFLLIYFFLASVLLNLLGLVVPWLVYLVVLPLATWLGCLSSFNLAKRSMYMYSDIANKSTLIFVGLNLIGYITLAIVQHHNGIYINDIGLFLCFVVFWYYTKLAFKENISNEIKDLTDK